MSGMPPGGEWHTMGTATSAPGRAGAHAERGLGGPTRGQVSRGELINTPNLTTAFPFFLPHLLSAGANLLNGAGVYLGAFSRTRHFLHLLKAFQALSGINLPRTKKPHSPALPLRLFPAAFVSRCVNKGGKSGLRKARSSSPRGLSRAL